MTNTARQTPDTLLAKAVSLHQAGDLDRAETVYQSVLSAQPSHSPALTLLGTLYLQRGDWSEGVALIERSNRVDAPTSLSRICKPIPIWFWLILRSTTPRTLISLGFASPWHGGTGQISN
jgi:tetratricopeptide (TPR) repeat protein